MRGLNRRPVVLSLWPVQVLEGCRCGRAPRAFATKATPSPPRVATLLIPLHQHRPRPRQDWQRIPHLQTRQAISTRGRILMGAIGTPGREISMACQSDD